MKDNDGCEEGASGDELRELIAEWRERAQAAHDHGMVGHTKGVAAGRECCADELEAVIENGE